MHHMHKIIVGNGGNHAASGRSDFQYVQIFKFVRITEMLQMEESVQMGMEA